jgi:hypothetical protein
MDFAEAEWNQYLNTGPEKFTGRMAEQILGGRVNQQDFALLVGTDYRIRDTRQYFFRRGAVEFSIGRLGRNIDHAAPISLAKERFLSSQTNTINNVTPDD